MGLIDLMCPHCGASLKKDTDATSFFCAFCGANLMSDDGGTEREPTYSSENRSYKCPACGSPLVFTTDGNLSCGSCGNTFSVDSVELLGSVGEGQEGFNWSTFKDELNGGDGKLDNTVTYVCRSCGAEIETEATTSATHCPYCDNEIIITDRLTGGLRPNAVIPFRVDKKGLEDVVRNYFKGKKLLPKDFLDTNKLSKVQGVYVPFWLFDAGIEGSVMMKATQVSHYSDVNYDYTETRYFAVRLDGSMGFDKVPVDGSKKMDDDLMDSIEPYDYSGLVDFRSGYLSGFLADRFDDDPDASLPRAEARMKRSAETELCAVANSSSLYTTMYMSSSDLRVTDASVKYVLLPVYLVNVYYGGKRYRFAVNGQTGKIVGELPVDKKKKTGYFLLHMASAAAVVGTILYFLLR
ncbi:MAG: hypothetical protein IKX86_02140 [Clostridia bacterium]|nr:hypothetical protein [Clostridia bacterium]